MGAKLSILLLVLCVSVSARLPAQEQLETTRQEASKLTKQDIPELRRRAEAGDPKAQLLLGHAYARGFGVRQKFSEAAQWYKKSADQGDALAQYELSILYQEGRGVPRLEAEGIAWCRRSAEQGLVEAQTDLGRIYVQQNNYAEAERWIRKAAEQGYFLAQLALAHLYAEGRGVQQDHQRSYMWILLARAARCGQSQQLCVERHIDWEIPSHEMRDKEAAELSAEQIAEGTRRASEWLKDHQKPPLPPETEEQRKTFLVSHQHIGAGFMPGNPGLRVDYCSGWITITKSMIRYISRTRDDSFQIPWAQLKEVSKTGNNALKIQLENGKKYSFYPINDRFEYQPPERLLDAINRAMGQK